MFDAHKLDISDELKVIYRSNSFAQSNCIVKSILDAIKPHQDKTRFELQSISYSKSFLF